MRVLQESPTTVKEEKGGCRDCGVGGEGEGERRFVGARGKRRERDARAGGSLWEFVIARSSAQGRGERGRTGDFGLG